MKRLVLLVMLCMMVGAAWTIADKLSSDAVGMAVGLFFGVAAGVTLASVVLVAGRRQRPIDGESHAFGPPQPVAGGRYGQPQLPVIIVAAPSYLADGRGHGQAGQLSQPWQESGAPVAADQRSFRIVGESERDMDEW